MFYRLSANILHGQHEDQDKLPILLTRGLPEPVSAMVIEHVAVLPEYRGLRQAYCDPRANAVLSVPFW